MERLNAQEWKHAAARKQTRGARAGSKTQVLFQDGSQPGFFLGVKLRESNKIAMDNFVGFAAKNVRETAGHAGAEIKAKRAEDEDDAARHIFAAVLADAFDNCQGAAITNGEALASAACDEKLAGGGAVKNGVASENVAAARGRGAGGNRDGATGETFSDVVVGFPGKQQSDSIGKKCAKALSRASVEFFGYFLRKRAVLAAWTAATHQFSTHAGANAAVGILDGLRFRLEFKGGAEVQCVFARGRMQSRRLVGSYAAGFRHWDDQQGIHSGTRAEAVVPAGEIAERTGAELCKAIANLFG